MNIFKIFGIDRITSKMVFMAIFSLTLLGLSVNSLYDLLKSLVSSDKNLFFIYISLPIIFYLWILLLYRKYKPIITSDSSSEVSQILPHRGIIMVLSTPKEIPEEINQQILEADDPLPLYEIKGIGQLFKGLYHHKTKLEYVWLIASQKSEPYKECIRNFFNKFIPKAKICKQKDYANKDYILKSKNDSDVIKEIKSILSDIYSKENLSDYNLEISEIVVDVSGGSKPMSIGMIFGALDSSIDIQYVEQNNHNVIGIKISPEMLFDQFAKHLLKASQK